MTSTAQIGLVFTEPPAGSPGYWLRAGRRLLRHRLAVAGLAVIVSLALVALLAPLIAPQDPAAQDVLNARQNPSLEHIAGTDALGRDLMSRLVYGARVSLAVGVVTQVAVLSIGLPLGLIAGLRGSWADGAIMRFADLAYAFPSLLLIVLLRAVMGGSLLTLILIIAFVSWMDVARMVRGQVLSLREQEFVTAAHSLGASDLQIMTRHLLPNLMGPLIVLIALNVPQAIIIEASLSFIGFGVDPSVPSWGSMVQEGQSAAIGSHLHMVVFPAAAIALVTLAFTFLGDGLRDALDPQAEDATQPIDASVPAAPRRGDASRGLPRAA